MEVKMSYPYKTLHQWIDEEESLGNVLRIKTPIKCGDYNNLVDIGTTDYNRFVDVRSEMKGKQPETDMRAIARYLHSLPGKPIGIIENPVDNRPDIPLAVNIWPDRERTLRGMGLKGKEEFVKHIGSILSKKIKPVKVSKGDALCKEVIIPEEKVDLRKDIPRVWAEFNKVCLSGCNGTLICYDPATGTHGMTKTRLGFLDWDNGDPNNPFPEEKVKKYGFATLMGAGSSLLNSAGRYYFENYRAKDKPWPAAWIFGLPTDVHMVAAYKGLRGWPKYGDEYELLGGFRGEPIDLVESETIPGLMVPAHSEWVVEGEFISEDYKSPPLSYESLRGFMWGGASWPVFRVKCITHRKQPLWTAASVESLGPNDHLGVHSGQFWLIEEVYTINHLRSLGFKVKDVVVMAGMWVTVIQLEVDGADKPHAHYGEEVGKAVGAKYTIVVGPDIDPYNAEEVMWAVGMRAGKSSWREPNYPSGALRPPVWDSIFNDLTINMGSLVIDATIPVPERFETFPPRSDPPEWEKAAIARIKSKIAGE